MRGRRRTIEEKQAEGDTRKLGRRKHEAVIDSAIPVEKGFPSCPSHLTGIARRMWNYWAPLMAISGVDYASAAPALANACLQEEMIVQCSKALKKHGPLIEEKEIVDGKPVVLRVRKNPAEQMRSRASMILRVFMTEFGMTALSRPRISAGESSRGVPTSGTNAALARLKAKIAVPTEKPRELKFLQ